MEGRLVWRTRSGLTFPHEGMATKCGSLSGIIARQGRNVVTSALESTKGPIGNRVDLWPPLASFPFLFNERTDTDWFAAF